MVNECNSTRGETSISIVPGPYSPLVASFVSPQRYSKGKDYTFLYGKNEGGEGCLTPFLTNAFDERVDK